MSNCFIFINAYSAPSMHTMNPLPSIFRYMNNKNLKIHKILTPNGHT